MQRAEQGVFLGDPENSSREMLPGEILQAQQHAGFSNMQYFKPASSSLQCLSLNSTHLKDVKRSLSRPRARHSSAAVAHASVMTTTHGAGDLPLTVAMEGMCTCDSTSPHTSSDAYVTCTSQV